MMGTAAGISAGMVLLLVVSAVCDLRSRTVPTAILCGLGIMALLGRPWPWWVATAAVFLVPRREWGWYLLPLPVLAGMLSGDGVPAVALTTGLLAWVLRWWGGADGVLLSVLALRYGAPGLWASAAALAVAGILTMFLRRRKPVAVLGAALGLLSGRLAAEEEVPAESELPAAAALAVAGSILEILRMGVLG